MKKIIYYYPLLLLLAIIFLIYFQWFQGGTLTSGDSRYYFNSMYDTKSIFPYAWSPFLGNGFGGNSSAYLWFYNVFGGIFTVGKIFGFSWEILDKFLILYPFLLLSIITSFIIQKLLRLKHIYSVLGSVIFSTNTYILMIMGGGQKFIGLSYAIAPLIIYKVFSFENEGKNLSQNLFHVILVSLLLVVQAFFDIRIAYITISAIVLFFLLRALIMVMNMRSFSPFFVSLLKASAIIFIPVILMLLIHSFWILPSILSHSNPIQDLGDAYSSIDSVRFFSFAKLEDSISLLHPNWPLNIFGKVGFLKPEFLVLPILAFASLLFVGKKQTKDSKEPFFIICFVVIGLVGAFLAKGANDPFGGIYISLFERVPGFQMFRDPTKWYLLVALSYSVLIPFTIYKISNKKYPIFSNYFTKEKIKFLILILFLIFWLFTIRFATFHKLGGTFAVQAIPADYFRYENFMNSDMSFSRSLWIPIAHKYSFYNEKHTIVDGKTYFHSQDVAQITTKIVKENPQTLKDDGIRYIVLPLDTDKQIYMDRNGYDAKILVNIRKSLDKIPWLTKVKGFNELNVYGLSSGRDLLYLKEGVGSVEYKIVNPSEINVSVSNVQKNSLLVFNSAFDKNWILKNYKSDVSSQIYNDKYNSFLLNDVSGSYLLSYSVQKYVNYGLMISFSTIISLALSYLFFKYFFKK